jgi:hypothetical protein
MSKKMSLLGAVALGSLATLAAATPAEAAKGRNARDAEIEALKARIDELTARLDAQEQRQSSTEAQAKSAQEQAAQAISASEATQSQVAEQAKAVPDQVKTALAAQPKPKPQWFDNTSISGRMYFNISQVERHVDGAKTESDGGFLIKRFYIGVDHKFNDIFSGNITTDVDSVIGSTSGSLVGKGLYVKKAYLQAKLDKALVIRLGSADLPWIPFAEDVYGYRHIENTLIDRTKFGTSADWGVHVMGELANGIVSYAVSAVDGGGYRDPKLSKTVDLEGRVSVKYKGVVAAVGGYTGKLGKDVQGATTHHTATRLNALLAYKTQRFTVGAEYFYTKNWTQVTTPIEDKADGYSLFASANVLPKVSLFGRYDWVKPRKDTTSDFKDNYFNVGVQYSPTKIVDLALVYKREKTKNGVLATSNGNIGGVADGTYDEFGLFGQFRF